MALLLLDARMPLPPTTRFCSLRAALNDGTQSLGAAGFFGTTPGSAQLGGGGGVAAGTHGKRASSVLRRDDELGAMSER